jgi:hypothetical protein
MRRRSVGGSMTHRSSGSIGMCIESLRQRDKVPQAFNAQLDLGPLRRVRLARRHRDQKGAPSLVLDLKGGRDVASPAGQPPQNPEATPEERMAAVADRHLCQTGTISLTRGDIPVDLRWKGSTGAHRSGAGGR